MAAAHGTRGATRLAAAQVGCWARREGGGREEGPLGGGVRVVPA